MTSGLAAYFAGLQQVQNKMRDLPQGRQQVQYLKNRVVENAISRSGASKPPDNMPVCINNGFTQDGGTELCLRKHRRDGSAASASCFAGDQAVSFSISPAETGGGIDASLLSSIATMSVSDTLSGADGPTATASAATKTSSPS